MAYRRLVFSPMVLLGVLAIGSRVDANVAGTRIRVLQHRLQQAFDEGLTRSPTLQTLVADIERSDVIVYVELVPTLPSGIDARLSLLYATAKVRYLHVGIGAMNGGARLVELLAHELQHVLEVARDAGVRNDDAIRSLYRRIGTESMNGKSFDSAAARIAQARVKGDLARAEPAQATALPR